MRRIPILLSVFVAICLSAMVPAQQAAGTRPNFAQAERFSPGYLRQRTYSSSVDPKWIGETEQFWYSYRTAAGTVYYFVDPEAGTKRPLFDHVKIASQLSVEVKRPLDANNLSLGEAKVDKEGAKLSFTLEKTRFELELASGKLVNLGPEEKDDKADSRERPSRRGSRGGDSKDEEKKDPRAHRNFSPDRTAYVFIDDHNLYFVEASDEVKAEILAIDERMKKEKEEEKAKQDAKDDQDLDGKADEEQEVGDDEDATKEEEVTGEQETSKEDAVDGEQETTEKEDDTDAVDEKQGDDGEKVVETEKVEVDSEGGDDTKADKKDDAKKESKEDDTDDKEEEEDKVDERERWADDVDESKALQLTEDCVEDYEFSTGRSWRRGASIDLDDDAYLENLQAGIAANPDDEVVVKEDDKDKEDGKKDAKAEDGDAEEEEEDTKARPRASWAPDSSAFYITRRDSRGVEELFLVNSLTEPRPSLETYDYPLPGEEHVGYSELHVFDRERKQLFQVESVWKDENYQNLHWPRTPERPEAEDDDEERPELTKEELKGSGDELRMLRRDRMFRNVELCSIDTRTGAIETLIEEGFEGANIAPQSVRYLKQRDEMIWWSERSGWGHFYLYGKDGVLKNAITSGPFRASRIVEVDQDKGLLYFQGNAREAGENLYYQHLYRVFLDGTGLTLMDPGDANHRSKLSPSQKFVVDNCSRVDMAPVSRLCDAEGNEVMKLEEADLSRLYAAGWTMPETFIFKAADGVTDLYGNMWKPFDFDPSRKYPIIAEVYPGPQTEGVSHSFSASNGRQQLAQVGFIVVQLGHRGGTPGRSKAYHSYGYYNLRDYGLADKKAGLEQLAERNSFIDLERIGIYGHSGGGFMSAAALLREPYNDFFKVAVASSGNHDNNVYGRYWAERYHGLKQVTIKAEKKSRGKLDKKGDAKEKAAWGDEKGEGKKDVEKDSDEETEEAEVETKFEIHVPTNAELAENLKGHLLLVHGDMDNNVHPAGTMRLVDALIKANKRFDMLIIPGKRHGYGNANGYFTQRKWEYFAEHLLGDHQKGADINQKD